MKISLLQNFNISKNSLFKINTKNFAAFSNPFEDKSQPKSDVVELSFQRRITSNSFCSPDKFEVKKIKNLRCPICHKMMLNDEQIRHFVNDVSTKKGKELVDVLEKYEDDSIFTGRKTAKKHSIYRPIEQQAVDTLKSLAIKYPNRNIRDLFQIQRNKSLMNIMPVQLEILGEYEEYALAHAKDDTQRKKIKEIVQEYKNQIYGNGKQKFERKKLIYSAVHSFDDDISQREINEIVQKLPSSLNNPDAFFVKYSIEAKTPKEAARKLVEKSTSSVEHLVPVSEGGQNRISNYIVDCQECNMQRQSTDFYKWSKTIPNFKNGMQKYINSVQMAIDAGILTEDWEVYIPAVIETVKELSKNSISVKLPETNNPKIRQKIFASRAAKLESLGKEIDTLKQKKNELAFEISEIESSSQYRKYDCYNIICQEISSVKAEIKEKKEKISNCEKKIEENEKVRFIDYIRLDKKFKNRRAKKENLARTKERAIKRSQREIYEYRQEIESLEAELDELFNEKAVIKSKMIFLPDIQSDIDELKQRMSRMEKYKEEIERIKKETANESEIRGQYEELRADVEDFEQINKQIASKQGFDVDDTSDFDTYRHDKKLLNYARNQQKQISANRKPRTNFAFEVYDVAIKTLEEKIEEYSKMDSVVYFENSEQINNLKNKLSQLQSEIKAIERKKAKIVQLQRKYQEFLGQDSPEDLDRRMSELSKEKELLLDIQRVGSMRDEYEGLLKEIEYKSKIYSKLKNYRSLTNEEYKKILQQLDKFISFLR